MERPGYRTEGTEAEKADGADSRARVAFLILELSIGGAEKALFQLVTTLDRKRFTPVVYVVSGRPEDWKNSLAPAIRANGIEVVELGLRGVVDAPASLWKLRRRLKRDRVDVLQCFMFHANMLGRLAGRLAGVPVVCSGVRVAERDAPLRLWLDRATRRLVDVWVCVGESVAAFTRETCGIPADRVVSIPNGITEPAATPQACVNSGRRRMIAVGRLTRQKGFDWLLEHADSWLTPEVERDWELWIVGDGEERDALKRLCAEKKLDDFVRFMGWREDAKELIASSDLFLLPSRWEGMPNALLEAAAAGRATLCRDVEGVAEILGVNAFEQRCAPDNVGEWRDKLLRLIEDGSLRETLGERNRRRVLTEFTVESTTRRYEALWTRLLNNNGTFLRSRTRG